MKMEKIEERSLSENLFFTVQSLDSLIKREDSDLDFTSVNSLIHYFREISLIIYHSSADEQVGKVRDLTKTLSEQGLVGVAPTALDSFRLLVQIGSELGFPKAKENL
jgi:hypothetical protein